MWYVSAFQRSVSHFRRMDSTPHLMLSDSLDKKLRNRIERQLTRLCDEHIAASHQKIGTIDSFKDIFMPESMNTGNLIRIVQSVLGKAFRILPVIKMLGTYFLHLRNFFEQCIPYIAVISYICIQYCFPLADIWKQVLYDRCKNLFLCSCASDCKQKTNRFVLLFALDSRITIRLNIGNQFMVNVMSRIKQLARRHRLIHFLFVHSV